MHVTHIDIPIFIDDNSTVLILGSLPSVKSREEGFYYAHKQNRFYKALSGVFGVKCPITHEERKLFLKERYIALYDVIYECDIVGSSDSSIKNPKVIDLEIILKEHPNIKVIGVNGGKAKALFDKYLKSVADNYDVRVVYLPSTSPANAKISLEELITQYSLLFNSF